MVGAGLYPASELYNETFTRAKALRLPRKKIHAKTSR